MIRTDIEYQKTAEQLEQSKEFLRQERACSRPRAVHLLKSSGSPIPHFPSKSNFGKLSIPRTSSGLFFQHLLRNLSLSAMEVV